MQIPLTKWIEVAKECSRREGECIACTQCDECAFNKYNVREYNKEPIAMLVDFILTEIGREDYR